MSQTPYPKILAFVEGMMERFFFNENFHYVELIPVSNGVTVSVQSLSKTISSSYIAKNMNADQILVWIDREGRSESSADIRSDIVTALQEVGAPVDRIFVGIADRMTENWILADEAMIRNHFGDPAFVYQGDGCNGSFALKQLSIQSGRKYKKTEHGVELLKKTRLRRSALVSPSADSFINGWPVNCWWTD